ncbi:MAG: hypothetical protein JO235_16415 [Chroococcidiopsidaceae cyanobacterium CP_BM_RX_35]|nr:hypothetical protein [Chroococcidiopsidaceae cyanobacterium CP_BM_RX_35]
MSLKELLNEARQLTWRDQLYLATQLLEWVQQRVSPDEQAIASDATEPVISPQENLEQGSIDYLMANPVPVRNFKPLSREEIYDRS